jgi:signal transduction histidine kinase
MNYFRHFWNWVITVRQTNPEQERLARLAAAVSAMLFAMTGVLSGWMLLTSGSNPTYRVSILLPGIMLMVYMLNRRGNYHAGIVGLLGVLAFAPAIVVLVDERDPALLVVTALAASIGVMLANVFFSGRNGGLAIALVAAALYLTLPLVNPIYNFADIVYPLIGLATLGLMTALYENHRTAVENDRRAELESTNKALQESEATLKKAKAKLEQQLKDSAVELDATVHEFLRAKEATDRAKEEAERASLVKSAFLASMSHELRTPLNAIINFTKFVAKGSMGPVNEEQAETLYEVIDSAKHLLSLINDVLDMSKIESGSLSLFIENNVELPAILDTVISTGKGLLAEKPVLLETDIAPDLPPVRGDRQRILQVLLNIMANACKFTDEGHIKLKAYRTQDDVRFAVEDTGPGITPEDQSAVFEAFKQTATGLRQGGGTGLGMPISKNLVEAHGGRLWLESEPGKGTTFFVALPIESAILAPTLVSPVGVVS